MHRALVIIPERWRQQQQKHLEEILSNRKDINADFLFIHQNNTVLFNKGLLMNIGFQLGKLYHTFDYIIIHDIDMFDKDMYDYTYTNIVIQMCGSIRNYKEDGKIFYSGDRLIARPFCGGVIIVNRLIYETINGFSNEFYGWGCEDVNFIERIKQHNVSIACRPCKFESVPNGRSQSNPQFYKNNEMKHIVNPFDGLSSLQNTWNLLHKTQHGNIYDYYVDFNGLVPLVHALPLPLQVSPVMPPTSLIITVSQKYWASLYQIKPDLLLSESSFICDMYIYDDEQSNIKTIYSSKRICIGSTGSKSKFCIYEDSVDIIKHSYLKSYIDVDVYTEDMMDEILNKYKFLITTSCNDQLIKRAYDAGLIIVYFPWSIYKGRGLLIDDACDNICLHLRNQTESNMIMNSIVYDNLLSIVGL